ncbi:exodeoxyribonuclease VII large subunit [Corynebacterium phocae]|uniref:Exodeoxyribonuclease 7 large subunit n=1 Tax=Corynebacterium phocae TaxID=161895 RepID=A0A1L7D498_9CORY|nr:exodeoxyribonuclease VII large subunit [Corynebacterium phocae]APT92841.1 exodeoxyribonuclease VII large subunit [Corynebacterium phocae]KAA8723160.1 exodeoxyribonuclease VII large subunit [Corynebacterium phocae]
MAQVSSTPEAPWSVAKVNGAVKGWIDRLGYLWVEGQLAQVNYKPTWAFAFVTLRDTQQEKSIALRIPSRQFGALNPRPKEGDRVIVHGKPNFYEGRGEFSLMVDDIRQVGIGELLARIELLRKQLAQEGLFAPERKKRLPFLPHRIGLITSRNSAAERDVISVARDRWPAVQFRVENAAVQGTNAVTSVLQALSALEQDPEVDVIIIARGGGSVEDLLPFSDEALQRAVAKCTTPVVSAIGHEPDTPILDNVADLRAATPTDAAKRVVPSAADERAGINQARDRLGAALRNWVERERRQLESLRSRPVMADPFKPINDRREELDRAVKLIRRDIGYLLQRETAQVASLRSQISTLGPSATLARGYAVVQVMATSGKDHEVVTTYKQTPLGSKLRIRVADGSISAATVGIEPAD